jgi:hypothetical protein
MVESSKETDVPKADLKVRSDFVAALVIMIFSIAVAINSIGMPRNSGWSTAAGLVPLILAVSLFLMALGLLVSAIKRDVFKLFAEQKTSGYLARMFSDISTRKTLCIIAITTAYITLLVGRVPFEVSGFVFLFVAVQMCWKKGSLQRKLALSILVPVVLAIVFRLFFNVFLPGDTLLELIF